MKKIHWIIISSGSRGGQYGVGSFIKQLVDGLSNNANILLYVIDFGDKALDNVDIRKDKNVLFLRFPFEEKVNVLDSSKNQIKIGRSIARILDQYILHDGEVIVHMNFLFQFFIARELKSFFNGKLIFTQHLFAIDEVIGGNSFDVEVETYKIVDRIVTVTAHGKEHLISKGVPVNMIEIIYNGISPHVFTNDSSGSIKKKYGVSEDEPLILFSGRIDTIKGLKFLALAFEKVLETKSNCRLIIAGNGDYDSLISYTSKFSSNVNFLGFIPFEDLCMLYKISDIGVIPSLEEHCSYVALEMLHSGLPVVATCLGGLKEIFVHGENALLADTVPDAGNMFGLAPNVGQLAEYIITLLNNASLREKFSRNAEQRANSIFSTELMVEKYYGIVINTLEK